MFYNAKSNIWSIIASLMASIVFTGSIAKAQTSTVTLFPSADNTLYESATGANSNGTGVSIFSGNTSQAQNQQRRAIMRFDLSQIPANAVIETASVTLMLDRTTDPVSRSIGLHRSLADWGEGLSNANANSGSGAPSTPGSVTWIHTDFPNQTWGNVGGDFATQASALQNVGGLGLHTWSGAGLVDDVQAWVDGALPNYGWFLVNDSGGARRFLSRESTSNQPVLTITFAAEEDTGDGEDAFDINVGLAGSWFNPVNPGQGFMLDVFIDIQFIFIAWFTHTTDGQLQWYTAGGDFIGGRAELVLLETQNGLFNIPTDVINAEVGGINIEFSDCLNGVIEFDIPDFDQVGDIPVTRIANDQICQSIVDGDIVIPNKP